MSDPLSIALVGATGLIGRTVMQQAVGSDGVYLTAISRREAHLPQGARMKMVVADPADWSEVLGEVQPQAMICALGTTWKRAGEDEDAFRAVDQGLVLETARSAKDAGVQNFVLVSSVGANLGAKALYLRVKAEVERDIAKMKFKRLDILQPGLLRGARIDDKRMAESVGQMLSPLINPFMFGSLRDMRAIKAEVVAQAALALAGRKAGGRFTHNNDAIARAARDWLPQHAGS